MNVSPVFSDSRGVISTNQAQLKPAQHPIYFGYPVNIQPPRQEELSLLEKFSKLKGEWRRDSVVARWALDFLGRNNTVENLFALGNSYVYGYDHYPKNLKMADHYFERAFENTPKKGKGHFALSYVQTLLDNFKTTEGLGDIVFKYLTEAQNANGNYLDTILALSLANKEMPLKDGSTLGKVAKALILDPNKPISRSDLERFRLLSEHFPEAQEGKVAYLIKASEIQELSPLEHKEIGDIYHEGTSGIQADVSKAFRHYEYYLHDKSTVFDKEITPDVLARMAELMDGAYEEWDDSNRHILQEVTLYFMIAAKHGVGTAKNRLKASPFKDEAKKLEQVLGAMSKLPQGTLALKATKEYVVI